jgi:hypothetical protein
MKRLFLTFFMVIAFCGFSKMQDAIVSVIDGLNGEIIQGASVTLNINPPRTKFWEETRTIKTSLVETRENTFHAKYQVGKDCGAACLVKKNGYYFSHVVLPKEISEKPHSVTVKLSPKINPIPLIMKRYHYSDDVILSYKGGEAGRRAFDCLKVDWLPPHGKGEQADILFTLEKCTIKSEQYICLSVTFTNPNDGVMLVKDGYASAMFIREAPQELHLIQALSFLKPLTYDGYVEDFPEKHNYVFRVRTSLTPSGEIASAYYGKLYDAFGWYTSNVPDQLGIMFVYFLNPTPNDRNLEDDGFPINTAIKGRKRRTTK